MTVILFKRFIQRMIKWLAILWKTRSKLEVEVNSSNLSLFCSIDSINWTFIWIIILFANPCQRYHHYFWSVDTAIKPHLWRSYPICISGNKWESKQSFGIDLVASNCPACYLIIPLDLFLNFFLQYHIYKLKFKPKFQIFFDAEQSNGPSEWKIPFRFWSPNR